MHDSRGFNSKDGGGEVTNKTEMCNKKVTNVRDTLRKKQMATSYKVQFQLKQLCRNEFL